MDVTQKQKGALELEKDSPENIDEPHTAYTEQHKEIEHHLQEGCNDLKMQLKQLHGELRKVQRHRSVQSGDPSVSVLEARYKQLHAQIDVIKESHPEGYPDYQLLLQELVINELERSEYRLHEMLEHLQNHYTDQKKLLENEKRIQNELKQLSQQIEKKLEEASGQTKQEITDARSISIYGKQKAFIHDYNKKLMKKMVLFMQENYPLPLKEELAEWHRKLLVNRYLDHPHDPYITVTGNYWPAYIELLLRSGIAIRHKDNDNKIKMTPFDS